MLNTPMSARATRERLESYHEFSRHLSSLLAVFGRRGRLSTAMHVISGNWARRVHFSTAFFPDWSMPMKTFGVGASTTAISPFGASAGW